MIPSKEALGYLSLVCIIVGYSPYFYWIMKRRIHPHVFSWVIWGIVAGVVFCAQCVKGAGPGAWATGAAALSYFLVGALALWQGDKDITRGDAVAFVLGLMTVPLWYITQNPLYAVLLAIVIDLLAYYPSFRKFYDKPHEEMILIYVVGAVQYAVALLAMGQYGWTIVLYPAFVIVANTSMISMLITRRAALSVTKL